MRVFWVLLASFVLLVAFLPKIASTSLGKPLFVRLLAKKTRSRIEVESLKFSWLGPQQFHNLTWNHDTATGTLEELSIAAPFWSFKGPFQLKNGTIDYKGGRVEHIEGHMVGKGLTLTGVTQQGHLALKGEIFSRKRFNLTIDAKQFPLAALDSQLDQVLGSVLDVSGTINFSQGRGNLDLNLSSPNFQTRLLGSIQNNALMLSEPLTASFRLTPEASALLLKDPRASFASETPITLRVDPKDFYYPLPFSLEKLKIHKATLDLGKVRCPNNPSLSMVMILLKADALARASEVTAWFSPVTFQIDQGLFEMGRMDCLLSNTIHLCGWGRVDLLKNRLQLTLGLPADTLRQAFAIKSVDDQYVLKIEVRGTCQEPEIVKGPAVAKIAALVAAGQLPKKGLLGELTDFFPKLKMDKDVPPAKRPFPWEKR